MLDTIVRRWKKEKVYRAVNAFQANCFAARHRSQGEEEQSAVMMEALTMASKDFSARAFRTVINRLWVLGPQLRSFAAWRQSFRSYGLEMGMEVENSQRVMAQMDSGKKQRAVLVCSEFMRRMVHGVLGVCVGRWRVALQNEMSSVRVDILKKQHAKELSHGEMDNATRIMLRTRQERSGRALTIMRHMVHLMISQRSPAVRSLCCVLHHHIARWTMVSIYGNS